MTDTSKQEKTTVESAGQEVLKMLNKLRDVAVGNARDLLDRLEQAEVRLDSRMVQWGDQEEHVRSDAWSAREELHASRREREHLEAQRDELKIQARTALSDEDTLLARDRVAGLIDVEHKLDACGARYAEALTRYDATLVDWQRTRDKLAYGEVRRDELDARRRSLEARKTLEMRAEQSRLDVVERERLEDELDTHGKQGPGVEEPVVGPTEEDIAARLSALRDEESALLEDVEQD